MKCDNADIKELLPSYVEGALQERDRERVSLHLASCDDCRSELALLTALAGEKVPDPGEAFWAALPDRIYREVRSQQEQDRKRPSVLAGLFGPFLASRWAWAAAAVVLLAVAAGYNALQTAPLKTAGKPLPDTGGVYVDTAASEQVKISELSPNEIASLNSWAGKELSALSLQEGTADMFMNGPEGVIEERLSDMNAQELKRLSRKLDTENKEDGT